MKLFWQGVGAILWKDVLLEARSKDITTSVAVFVLLVAVIFGFALGPIVPETSKVLAPGILWVAFAFAGVLSLNRVFVLEQAQGSLDGLILSPLPREAIYVGKMLGVFLFMLVIEALTLPFFAVLLNVAILDPGLVAVVVLATLGFAAVGTLFSAMAVNTRSREIMLPVLLFPIVVPVFLGAVKATEIVMGFKSWDELFSWLQVIVIFDVIYLVVSSLVFEHVLGE